MNDIQNDLRRSVGYTAAPTVRRIIEKRGAILTEGQIETAGKAYVRATVWTMAADLVLDGLRLVARTVWMLATYAAVIAAGVWTYQHWAAILRWLK